ncbi:MAG: hypothetical protein LBE81_12475 [Azonexus sp.]|jgi:hypothetical protein|uniref:hypothetical protein n=1 Tax=Azonexus sp. TaxID=1872668 RepID=UPI00281A3D58|nr:hypothetical protein [Azonexus sp.]MDR0777433.1 hypothetical protein [Azonexus sp.]
MSILSDLDPKNNRLQANNPRASSVSLWWLLVLPLLLAGIVWWLYQMPGSTDANPSSLGLAVPLSEVAADTASAPASDSAAGHAEMPAFPNKNNKGSAVILSGEGGMNNADASLPQAVSLATPAASGAGRPSSSIVFATASETKTSQPAAVPVAKHASKSLAAKAGKVKKTNAATNQPPQDATEKAKERDVDIISVIVR